MICNDKKSQLILEKFIESLKKHPLDDFKERINIAIKALKSDLIKEHGL